MLLTLFFPSERLKADHSTELETAAEKAKAELSESKRKQWCYNCEAEAIYWCCWNTAYCSTDCQQSHWHRYLHCSAVSGFKLEKKG